MDLDTLVKLVQLVAPAGAAWVAVKVGIERALSAAQSARDQALHAQLAADKAHSRIDSILERGKA